MHMHDPSTPGEILAGWLEGLDMSVTAFAAHVGVSRVMLSSILNGHAAVTADMDLRLHEALGTSPGCWLRLQTQRDLRAAGQRAKDRRRWHASPPDQVPPLARVGAARLDGWPAVEACYPSPARPFTRRADWTACTLGASHSGRAATMPRFCR